jgi:broad specificity phosphatase PhoE
VGRAGRGGSMTAPNIAEIGADLIRRLDELVTRIDNELSTNSETLALLRQSVNKTIFAGMPQIPPSGTFHQDFTVPFASVAIADPNGAGPLVLAVDGPAGVSSIGSAQLAANDVACLPLHGRSIDVTGTPGKSIFIAVFTRVQPFYWDKC